MKIRVSVVQVRPRAPLSKFKGPWTVVQVSEFLKFMFEELKGLETVVYTRSPDYLYRRNRIYYFTRNVPSDLKARFNKSRVVVSLHTRSIAKAEKSALALCDRLDRYFESLRFERFQSQELGLKFSGQSMFHLMRRIQVLIMHWNFTSD